MKLHFTCSKKSSSREILKKVGAMTKNRSAKIRKDKARGEANFKVPMRGVKSEENHFSV
jgi:hypothetical protein